MKTQFVPVLIATMLAGTAAHARPNDDDGERGHQREERHQPAAPQPQPQQPQQPQQQQQQEAPAQPRERQHDRPAPQANQSDGQRPGRGWQPMPSAPRAGGNGSQGSGQQASERSWRGYRPQGPDQNPNRRPNWQADRGPPQNVNQQRNWHDSQGHDWRANRGWYDRYRVDHFRVDRGRYFGRQRYSVGIYAYPRGYSTRLWLAGEWLPSAFFIDGRYDLGNYWVYDLYEPPLGCRWTRVGNDALLIDEETGEVLDAVYDLFW